MWHRLREKRELDESLHLALQEMLDHQKFETKEQMELAQQRRLELEAERQEKAERLLWTLEEQERHVQMVHDAKRAERDLRAELARQRESNHADNMERLNKTYDYRHEMKQRRVEAERERIERRARAKRELDESLHLARLAMARDREMLLEQVERLSSSAAFLKPPADSTDRSGSRQTIVRRLQMSLELARRPKSSSATRPMSSPAAKSQQQTSTTATGQNRPNSSPTRRLVAPQPAATATGRHVDEATTPVRLVTAHLQPAAAAAASSSSL